MTTAFLLSGGGGLGAVQVGMLLALAERAITSALVIGTSVGAVNAAWVGAAQAWTAPATSQACGAPCAATTCFVSGPSSACSVSSAGPVTSSPPSRCGPCSANI
ncbi:MAG: hypothetical protein NVSMB12_16670 [Acidimicrobiales bacterium]